MTPSGLPRGGGERVDAGKALKQAPGPSGGRRHTAPALQGVDSSSSSAAPPSLFPILASFTSPVFCHQLGLNSSMKPIGSSSSASPLASWTDAATAGRARGLDSHRRKWTTFSRGQLLELQRVFAALPYPDISTHERLAWVTHLPEGKIQVWSQNHWAKKIKNRKLEGLNPRPEVTPPHKSSYSLPDTLQQPCEPRRLGQPQPSNSTPVCSHSSCPAPSLGPGQGWAGAKAAVPRGLAGASEAHPSLKETTPQTSLGSLSDLIYASAVITNLDHS
ncbi:LOW QUALITY PROTEIN: homeobox protein SEBOX [Dugong dugon]